MNEYLDQAQQYSGLDIFLSLGPDFNTAGINILKCCCDSHMWLRSFGNVRPTAMVMKHLCGRVSFSWVAKMKSTVQGAVLLFLSLKKKKKRGRESWPLILCSDWRRSINGYQTETLVIYTTPCRFHTKGWGKQHAFFYKLNRIWRDRKCMWFSTTIFLFLKVYLSTILMGFPGVSFYFIPFITAEDLQ